MILYLLINHSHDNLSNQVTSPSYRSVPLPAFLPRSSLPRSTQSQCSAAAVDADMKLSLARYRSMLLVQYTFLIIDLLINTFSELFRFESVILLVIFVYAISVIFTQTA